jgi:hypothetical protein
MKKNNDDMSVAVELINAMTLVDELRDCPRKPTYAEIDNLYHVLLRLMQICCEASPDSEPPSKEEKRQLDRRFRDFQRQRENRR